MEDFFGTKRRDDLKSMSSTTMVLTRLLLVVQDNRNRQSVSPQICSSSAVTYLISTKNILE